MSGGVFKKAAGTAPGEWSSEKLGRGGTAARCPPQRHRRKKTPDNQEKG